jgi:hypothetical protein
MDKRDRGWINTHSGTCNPGHYRIALMFALYKKLKAGKADVKTAFLQAKYNGGIVIKLPHRLPAKVVEDFKLAPGGCYPLLKAMYGTIDAPREFTQQFKAHTATVGFPEFEESLLVKKTNPDGEADGIIVMHVDDTLCFDADPKSVFDSIHKKFELDDPETMEAGQQHTFVGMDIEFSTDGKTCTVGQRQYAAGIKTQLAEKDRRGAITERDLSLAAPSEVDIRLCPRQQSYVGKLSWLSVTDRNLSVVFSEASRNNTKPSAKTLVAVQRLCEWAAKNHNPLKYDGSVKQPALVFWVDAAFCLKRCDGRIGWAIQLVDKSVLTGGKLQDTIKQVPRDINIVNWRSRRVQRRLGSSTAAELLALRDGIKMMPLYSRVVKHLWGVEPYQVYATDNQPLLKWLNNMRTYSDPEWQGTLEFVAERVRERSADVIWVPTKEQRADRHTKFVRQRTGWDERQTQPGVGGD